MEDFRKGIQETVNFKKLRKLRKFHETLVKFYKKL